MTSDKEKKNKLLSDEKRIIEQDVKGYDRDVELVEFVCACPNCPLCQNEQMWAHPNRKYCDQEAMLLHRQKQRVVEALIAGRLPGQVGRPRKNVPTHILYMVQASDTNFYKVDWAEDHAAYLERLDHHQSAIPKGIEEVFHSRRPYCEQVVEALYDLYGQDIINDQWLELSDEKVTEITEMFT